MCIIVVQLGAKKLTTEECKNAMEQNKDGFGFLFTNKGYYIYKTLNKDKAISFYERNKERIIALHFRYATIGQKNLNNVQPFADGVKLYGDEEEALFKVDGYVFAHNGHIEGLGDKVNSDSAELFNIVKKLDIKSNMKLLSCLNSKFFIFHVRLKKYAVFNFMEEDRKNKFFASNMGYQIKKWYENDIWAYADWGKFEKNEWYKNEWYHDWYQ